MLVAPLYRPIAADGQIRTQITTLEMRVPPVGSVGAEPAGALLLRAADPPVDFYRYLYDRVGGPWLWYERRAMSDPALLALISDPKIELHVLYINGIPAGYGELDCRREDEVELAYFGLMPEFVGRRMGPWLLRQIVDRAWLHRPARVWVNTNSLDHPSALRTYKRVGFVPYRQIEHGFEDPRLKGLFPEYDRWRMSRPSPA